MDDHNQSAYEDLGPHRRSTSTGEERHRKPPSAKTQRLIGELGLRYPPASQADLEQHAATLALLASDVADVNPDLLERAIEDHVRNSVYMPKAAELIAGAKQFEKSRGKPDLHAIAAKHNSRLLGEGRRDIQWVVVGDELKLESL